MLALPPADCSAFAWDEQTAATRAWWRYAATSCATDAPLPCFGLSDWAVACVLVCSRLWWIPDSLELLTGHAGVD
jgi:hypothetical protein